jgi:hypothetical protein
LAIIAASGGSAPEWFGGGDVLDPLHLGSEPVAVEELGDRAVEDALDPLGAAPVVELPLGLDAGQVLFELLGGHERRGGGLAVAHGEGRALGLRHRADSSRLAVACAVQA